MDKKLRKGMVDAAKAIIDTYGKDEKKQEKKDIENLNWAMEHINDTKVNKDEKK